MTRILLAGCGKMGSALLEGWLDQGAAAADLAVIEPGDGAQARFGGRVAAVVPDLAALPASFHPDVVVLAVKPQVMAAAAAPYARFTDAVFLSIAAGKPLAFFAELFGPGAAVVRAMPNTPAAVRRGVTVLCANALVTPAQREACATALRAVGSVEWIEDEGLMDAVTALSGSGPAYVFYLVEALAEAGRKAGLPADLAARLARETVAGSGELLARSDEEAAQLRQNVTSPGGTTAAALAVLMGAQGISPVVDQAIAAAAARSRELAG